MLDLTSPADACPFTDQVIGDEPPLPFVQQRFRNEAHSHTLEGPALEAYEAQFDGERQRLRRAVQAWQPEPPERREYARLRNDICTYNASMRNGYARSCFEFEQQELRGRQEAFKARIRHDLLSHYDTLARACKNLWVPDTYVQLQRKARKAMCRSYPELFDIARFDAWRGEAPLPEAEDADSPGNALAEAVLSKGELSWVLEAPAPTTEPLRFEDREVLQALAAQSRPSDARKLLFAMLRRKGLGMPALAAVRAGVADLRNQLTELEQSGAVEKGAGLLNLWDEDAEPTWLVRPVI